MQRLQATQDEIKRTVSENVDEINKAIDNGEDVTQPLNELRDQMNAAANPKSGTDKTPTNSSTES